MTCVVVVFIGGREGGRGGGREARRTSSRRRGMVQMRGLTRVVD